MPLCQPPRPAKARVPITHRHGRKQKDEPGCHKDDDKEKRENGCDLRSACNISGHSIGGRDSENDHDEGGEHEKQDPAGVAHLPPAEMTADPAGRSLSEEGRAMPCDGKSNDKGKIEKLCRVSLKPRCEESPRYHA